MITHRFNRILRRLADYSDRVRHKKIDDTENMFFNREEADIQLSYQRGEITRAEYEALNRIFYLLQEAARDALYTDGSIYTWTDWRRDGSFKALPGQEITREVYDEMRNCTPPKTFPKAKARQALSEYEIPVQEGFLMGEATRTDTDGQALYLSFGMNSYEKGEHFYFLGLAKEEKKLNGSFYYFECGNAFVDGLYNVSAFTSDGEAIRKAADYEATLYRYEYQDGEQTDYTVLYDPI